MRKLATALGALIVLAATPVPAEAAKRHPICGPAAAKTVRKTDRLRIYSAPARYGGTAEYVCSRYSRRVWTLTERYPDECYSSQGCGGRTMLLVAGRWVVEVVATGGPDTYFHIYRRAAGARRESWLAGGDSVHRAVLHRRGGAAWIVTRRTSFADPGRVVVERSGGCGPSQLDEGPDVDPKSLRLDGDRVTWTKAGVAQSAPLCAVDR